MKVKLICLLFLFNLIFGFAQAQIISIKVPIKQDVRIGQEVVIPLNVQGIKNYTIKMDGNPQSAVLEENLFRWIPKPDEKDYYFVKFELLDSGHVLIDRANLELIVKPSDLRPYIVFDTILADTIKIVENQTFSFAATIKSRQNTDPGLLSTYFTFNENPEIRSFDSCKIQLNGDQLLFSLTPSNKEAILEYLKFRITVIDYDKSIFSKVLNFKIQNINQEPHFKSEIPDTIFLSAFKQSINYAAIDPDNDRLKYDYSPKGPSYMLQGTSIVFSSEDANSNNSNLTFPLHLTLKVSDNNSTIQKRVTVLNDRITYSGNPFLQPMIGDFTKKIFSEGDSLLTYLNISNCRDLNQMDIICSDLTLPRGIRSLTNHLIFEKKDSYIKVYSKDALPYSLVNKDFNYNISILLSSKGSKHITSTKVLTLTIEDRPDPKSIVQKKDSLIKMIHNYLRIEDAYQAALEKVHNRINRPWWKKAAIVTGALSGVLTLIQSQNSDKTISAISASVSLVSIMVSNIPSLSEKTLSEIDEKVANSKSRVERVQEKESEFYLEWSIEINQFTFDKMKAELEELITKSTLKRNDEICSLLNNKKIKNKIDNLIKKNSNNKDKEILSLGNIFKCGSK